MSSNPPCTQPPCCAVVGKSVHVTFQGCALLPTVELEPDGPSIPAWRKEFEACNCGFSITLECVALPAGTNLFHLRMLRESGANPCAVCEVEQDMTVVACEPLDLKFQYNDPLCSRCQCTGDTLVRVTE